MEKILGLTSVEYELMLYFWGNDKPVYFSEILHYFNEIKGKSWAKTTIHTYLTTLIRKGLLRYDSKGYKHCYEAVVSKAELAHEAAQSFVNSSFNGSVKDFLVSLTQNKPMTCEEVTELHQILDEIVQ